MKLCVCGHSWDSHHVVSRAIGGTGDSSWLVLLPDEDPYSYVACEECHPSAEFGIE